MKSGKTPVLFFMALAFAVCPAHARADMPANENTPARVPADAKPVFPAEIVPALENAAKSNRDVVVVLNIPDSDGWCARIRSEVLEQPRFATAMEGGFIVVNLNFSRKTPEDPEAAGVRDAYAKRYRIKGYPVLLLLDKSGRAYAKTGYRKESPEAYAAHLAALKSKREKRDARIDKSRRNQGYIRAEMMAGALGSVDASLIADYAALFEELRSVDAQDRKGVLADYDITRLVQRAEDKGPGSGDEEAGVREFDAFLAGHPGLSKIQRQRVLLARFMLVPECGEDTPSRIADCEKRLGELREMASLESKSWSMRKIARLIESEEARLARLRKNG